MARRPAAKRSRLLDELMLQARRSGSLGTLHNRAAAELAGVNETDWECLDVLDWTGPITAGELARRVGITSGAVTGAIDRLERLGLVRRARRSVGPSQGHRRARSQQPVGVVARGNHKLTACFGALAEEIAALNEEFDEEHLDALIAMAAAEQRGAGALDRRMREAATTP